MTSIDLSVFFYFFSQSFLLEYTKRILTERLDIVLLLLFFYKLFVGLSFWNWMYGDNNDKNKVIEILIFTKNQCAHLKYHHFRS